MFTPPYEPTRALEVCVALLCIAAIVIARYL
jgi:hypothetical protein